ncbi:MAG: HupE/UreJ family protein [Planctomycetes bacterium]|nr:HupE/UreJ family protein [Planctomycetota bacterium]
MCYYYKLAAAITLAVGAVHPAAMSHLNLKFSGNEVNATLKIQELTLREIDTFTIDVDGNGHITQTEFEDSWPQVDALLQSSFWFELNGEQFIPTFTPTEYLGDVDITDIVLSASFAVADADDDFIVHSELFLDVGNPQHKTFISVDGFGAESLHYVLSENTYDYLLHLPTQFETLASYTDLGFEHVLSGYDHLAFLLALLFGVASLRKLVYAITAFTVAHSITLAFSALDIVSLPSAFVEPAISISIIAVLVAHLKQGVQNANPAIPAFAFGLLHGFGFAGVLGEIGLASNAKVMSLLGFNVGVELGQLAFIIPVIICAYLIHKYIYKVSLSVLALPIMAFAMNYVGLYIGIAAALICVYTPWPKNKAAIDLNSLFINATLILLAFNAGRWLA